MHGYLMSHLTPSQADGVFKKIKNISTFVFSRNLFRFSWNPQWGQYDTTEERGRIPIVEF
jgi:hypothetical protein